MHRLLGSLLEELVAAVHCSLDTLCMALSLASRFKTFRSAPRTSSSSASSSAFRLTHRPSRTSTHAHNKREREKREERGKSERQRSRQSTKPELNQSPPRLLPPLLQGLSFLVPLPLLTASCSPSPSLTQRCLYSRTTRRTSRPEPMETVEAS